MKFRMDEPLRFWVDVAYENIKSDHPKLTKRQVIVQILHQYQERGDAMRYLDVKGKIAWKSDSAIFDNGGRRRTRCSR
jgi:hypothetical protein